MRTISAQQITDTVARLCIEANTRLPRDVQEALDKARAEEPWPLAKNTLDLLWSDLAARKKRICPSVRIPDGLRLRGAGYRRPYRRQL